MLNVTAYFLFIILTFILIIYTTMENTELHFVSKLFLKTAMHGKTLEYYVLHVASESEITVSLNLPN